MERWKERSCCLQVFLTDEFGWAHLLWERSVQVDDSNDWNGTDFLAFRRQAGMLLSFHNRTLPKFVNNSSLTGIP